MSRNEKTELELLSEINKTIFDLTKWIKFIGIEKVKKIIQKNLTSSEELLLYHYSDGEKTTRELESLTGINISKISKYWDEWEKLSIIEKKSASGGGRGKKIFLLTEVGIEIPKK